MSDPAILATPAAGLPTATGTQSALPTSAATLATSPTVLLTPTAVPTLAVVSIAPAIVINDQPARIMVSGGGFVDPTYVVTVGGRPLSDVHVESVTELTGTLSAGLCPGPYTATVQDTAGHLVSGGGISLQSVRSIIQDEAPTALSMPLTGWTQRRSVALPPVQVEDSGCGATEWRLVLAVAVPRDNAHGKSLTPAAITVRWADGGTAIVKMSQSGGHQQGTLTIPRNGLTRLFLTPSLDFEVPASAYAGTYTTTLLASFAD